MQTSGTAPRSSPAFQLPAVLQSLRVASGETQTQRPPAPEGQGAPGCGPVPGAWRGGAHTPFLQTHRFSGPASSGPSSAPPPCGPGPRRPELRALRRPAPGPRLPPRAPGNAARGGGGGGSRAPRRSVWVPGAQGREAGRSAGGGAAAASPPPARPPPAGWRGHGGLHPVLSLRGERPGAGIHGRRGPRPDGAPEAGPRLLSGGGAPGRRRPCAGGPPGCPPFPPLPGPEAGLRPGAVVRETPPHPLPGSAAAGARGSSGSLPSPSRPRSRPRGRSGGSQALARGARHSPRRPPSAARGGLRSRLAQLPPLPRPERLRGASMLASKFCGIHSDGKHAN